MTEKKSRDYADLAVHWVLAPVVTLAAGFVLTRIVGGWNAVAVYFWMLILSGILCLAPIGLAVIALVEGTEKREKAIFSIVVPIILTVLYMSSIGN